MADHQETYKGREIVVRAPKATTGAAAVRAEEPGEHDEHQEHSDLEVLIDGKPIQVTVAQDGSYESHEFMFQVFASPAELARAKVDQMPAK